jgi:hypothetical protein
MALAHAHATAPLKPKNSLSGPPVQVGNPSTVMQALKQRFAQRVVRRRRRTRDHRQGWLGAGSDAGVATTVLRFQCLDGAQAHREAALHASQSGEARIGGIAGPVAVEQFSILSVRRERIGTHQPYRPHANATKAIGDVIPDTRPLQKAQGAGHPKSSNRISSGAPGMYTRTVKLWGARPFFFFSNTTGKYIFVG